MLWILAFDATCGTCREISAAVDDACDGRLDVRPLADQDVRAWRDRALGADAEWAPTLLRVDGDRVRAWTGAAMSVPLARRLGPVASVRVVTALGRLRRRAEGKAGELPGETDGIGRKQFLRFGAGTAVAAGLLLAGKAPAFGAVEKQTAQAWVNAHRSNLPQTYDQVVKYSETYRRAIFQALPAKARSALWTEHLKRYRAANPNLTAAQREVLDRAAKVIAKESTFAGRSGDVKARQAQAAEMYKATWTALGGTEAYRAFGVLGPANEKTAMAAAALPDCECAFQHDYCHDRGLNCNNDSAHACNYADSGCGWVWGEPCAGLCA